MAHSCNPGTHWSTPVRDAGCRLDVKAPKFGGEDFWDLNF